MTDAQTVMAPKKRSAAPDERAADEGPSKAARLDIEGAELRVFDFVDSERRATQSIALDADALACVPYLQTLVSTGVGAAPPAGMARMLTRRVVHLPPGCTSAACRSLVLKASAHLDGHVLSV